MALMKSCCCFSNMKSACLAAGIFTVVIAGMGLVGCFYMGSNGFHVGRDSRDIYAGHAWYVMIPAVLIYGALLVGGILLIVGSRRGCHGMRLIMTYIVIKAIYLFLLVGLMVTFITLLSMRGHFHPMIIFPLAVYVVLIIFMVLSFLSAISLYQQLKEEGPNGPLSAPKTQVVAFVTSPGMCSPEGGYVEASFKSDMKCSPEQMAQPPPYSPA